MDGSLRDSDSCCDWDNAMTEEQFEQKMSCYELDYEYSEYIAEQQGVCNGDHLIRIIESGHYYEDFKDHMTGEKA